MTSADAMAGTPGLCDVQHYALGPWGARACWTSIEQGDLGWSVDEQIRLTRQRAILDRPWSTVRQIHGAEVVEVTFPGQFGGDADALVSISDKVALSVMSADCGTVALASPQGVIGAVHVGWRGLVAGVIANTVARMKLLGATAVAGALGPCIHPSCYEFSPADLDMICGALGDHVRSTSSRGKVALDLPAGVRSCLSSAGVEIVAGDDTCTSCSDRHFSHRRDGSLGRQALVVWRP